VPSRTPVEAQGEAHRGLRQVEVTACAEAHRPHRLEGPQGVGVDGQDAARAGLSLLTVLSH
jgi:hypothetical protein